MAAGRNQQAFATSERACCSDYRVRNLFTGHLTPTRKFLSFFCSQIALNSWKCRIPLFVMFFVLPFTFIDFVRINALTRVESVASPQHIYILIPLCCRNVLSSSLVMHFLAHAMSELRGLNHVENGPSEAVARHQSRQR
jgi:hypothetical protein